MNNGWISVDDELPKPFEDVLVFVKTHCICTLHGESVHISELEIYPSDGQQGYEYVVCTNPVFTNLIYDLLEIEDGHR